MLARAGFVVALVPVNVSGFRLVLARGWHGQTSSLSGKCVIRSDFRIFADELQRAVHTRPLMSVGVATGRYSVGYSPPGLTARSPGPKPSDP
jgi:hypothetical protein